MTLIVLFLSISSKGDAAGPGTAGMRPARIRGKRKKHKKSHHGLKRRKTSPCVLELEVSPSSLTESAQHLFVNKEKVSDSCMPRSSSRKRSKDSHKLLHVQSAKLRFKDKRTTSRYRPLELEVNHTIKAEVREYFSCLCPSYAVYCKF